MNKRPQASPPEQRQVNDLLNNSPTMAIGDLPSRPRKKKRPCTYRKNWEELYPWLTCAPDDQLRAMCLFCNSNFSIANGGVTDVKQHQSTSRHKRNSSPMMQLDAESFAALDYEDDQMNIHVNNNSDSHVTEEKNNVMNILESVLEINVGGTCYCASLDTLRKESGSYLAKMFSEVNRHRVPKDEQGRYFIDRDGTLFRFILEYLRNPNLVLPDNFQDKNLLLQEAKFYNIPSLVRILNFDVLQESLHTALESGKPEPPSNESSSTTKKGHRSARGNQHSSSGSVAFSNIDGKLHPIPEIDNYKEPGFIRICYRETVPYSKDNSVTEKVTAVERILVSGKASLCREVFKDALSEVGRHHNREDKDQYLSKLSLKHSFPELAFDMLQKGGFSLVGSSGSGSSFSGSCKSEDSWQHYSEYVFERR